MRHLALFFLSLALTLRSQAAAAETPQFVGSQSCRDCHERFYGLWSTSHHGLAMQPYTAELARTRLTPQPEPLVIGPYRYQAEPEKSVVREQGPDGEKSYRIAHTLGGKNVFYFLTPLERGRLQTLPVAYDVNRKQWFDTAGSAMRHFGSAGDTPLFWKETPYTFNTSCYSCHVSQLARNYDSATDSYQTTWGEPGINCETCHGPASEHVRLARATPAGQQMKDVKLIVTRSMTPAQTNAMCGSCHAKLSPLTQTFSAGDRFFDHFGMTALEDPDFYPDGRDLGENFTMTTWGLSPCLKSGRLDCVDCHTSSGRYKFREGNPNAACLPCHEAKVKNVAAHSHHREGSRGAHCVSCHMPMTEFARMRRSDHSMRPPSPAATLAFGSPNACNLCHKNKDAAWADKIVRSWHEKDYQALLLQRASLIDAARKSDWTKLPAIVAYLSAPTREEIWAASLLRLLRGCPDDAKWAGVLPCLTDPSPLVRAAAVEALGEHPRPEHIPAALAAVRDDYRLVRVRAAAALAGQPPEAFAPDDRAAVAAATAEYLASLQVRPDDSQSRYNLGNYHLERQDFARAIAEYDAASRFLPQSLPPHVNRALAYAALGQNEQAEANLRRALAIDPANAAVNLNLGMLLAEQGKLREAEQALRTALKSDPLSAQAAYNLGVMLAAQQPEESLQFCRLAATLQPQEARYGYTFAFFLNQQGKVAEAIPVLEAVLRLEPNSAESYVLLGAIYERSRRIAEAIAVYQRGSANARLPANERGMFEKRAAVLKLK